MKFHGASKLFSAPAGGKKGKSPGGYALAVSFVGLAALARLSLDSLLGQDVLPYAFLYLAVALTAWLLGSRPAILAMLLGLLGSIWLIVPPRHSFALRGIADVMEILLYVLITGIVICLFRSLHQARAKAEASTQLALQRQSELETEVQQRKQTEAALRRSEEQLKLHEKVLEKKVADRTARLQESVHELEHFSYALIHDLRAPLRAMQMFSQLVAEDSGSELSPASKANLERVMSAAMRLDKLIQDSLNYNRAVLETLPLQPVDLRKLLSGLVETYPNLVPHRAEIDIQPNLPSVLGNEAALTQCFAALLDNAVKFTNAGRQAKVHVRAEVSRNEGRLRVCVEDNGSGIPLHVQGQLFGMFQRHDRTRAGTGMGLAIVRKLTEKMGGQVELESREGQGSRFWLELQRPASQCSKSIELAIAPVKSI